MKIIKYFLIITLIISTSCRKKDINNPLDNWFQDPPVSPIRKTIKTVIPIGYAATAVMMHMKGYKNENVKAFKEKNANILYIDTDTDYPYKFKDDDYGQMIVAYIGSDENTAFASVFFTDMNIISGDFTLKNVIAFPIIFDEINNKITAVFASIDINLGSNSNIGIDLTPSEMDEVLLKLENERTDITEIAVTQNAWIIDIYHQNTFDNMLDDQFKIYGGQQAVEVEDYDTESSTGAMQMAMIDVSFSADCVKNPTSGFVFMQDVEIATSENDNDIVFGHVFYEFHPNCDGEVLVDIATGNFLTAIGKELDLGLY